MPPKKFLAEKQAPSCQTLPWQQPSFRPWMLYSKSFSPATFAVEMAMWCFSRFCCQPIDTVWPLLSLLCCSLIANVFNDCFSGTRDLGGCWITNVRLALRPPREAIFEPSLKSFSPHVHLIEAILHFLEKGPCLVLGGMRILLSIGRWPPVLLGWASKYSRAVPHDLFLMDFFLKKCTVEQRCVSAARPTNSSKGDPRGRHQERLLKGTVKICGEALFQTP